MNFNKDKKLATTASPSCLVGYALNAKKLRKSDNNNHAKKIWSGGGLADILTEEIEDGVAFKSFDFDLPLEEQVSEAWTKDLILTFSFVHLSQTVALLPCHPS
jgi:hypothetical protein